MTYHVASVEELGNSEIHVLLRPQTLLRSVLEVKEKGRVGERSTVGDVV